MTDVSPHPDQTWTTAAHPEATRRDPLGRYLWPAVALLGSASFSVALVAPVPAEFAVHLSLLAGVVAAVSLLPGYSRHGWVSVPLSVGGLADAVLGWATDGLSGWSLAVVTALNALQAVAALVALATRTEDVEQAAVSSGYAVYAQYAQAYHAYQNLAFHYQQSAHDRQDVTFESASGTNSATVFGTRDADVRAKYSLAEDTHPVLQTPNMAASPAAPTNPAVVTRRSTRQSGFRAEDSEHGFRVNPD